MKSMIDENRMIVPAHKSRKALYCTLDIKSGDYFILNKNNCDLNIAENVKQYTATLYAVHYKFNVYGIIKDTSDKSKPNLWWIRGKEIESIKDTILNFDEKENIIDISDEPLEYFINNAGKSKLFSLVRRSGDTLYRQVGAEKFIELIKEELSETVTNDGDKIKNEDISNSKAEEEMTINTEKNQNVIEEKLETTENTEETIEEKQANTDNTFKTLLNFMSVMKQAAVVMTNEAEALNKEKLKYKDAISRISGELNLEDEKLIEVSEISSIIDTDDTISEDNTQYYVYDTILKLMRQNDTMSIPREYYCKLNNIIRKNISLSRDGLNYNAIVEIKFYSKADNSILARVEYDENKEYTRITVLKQYNSIKITDSQVIDYYIKYNQWRKHNSYTTSN